MLGLGETLARRRGLLRAMKSLRGLEDYYRRIVRGASVVVVHGGGDDDGGVRAQTLKV